MSEELTDYQKARAWDALVEALNSDDPMSKGFRLVMAHVGAQASVLVEPRTTDPLVRQLVEALRQIKKLAPIDTRIVYPRWAEIVDEALTAAKEALNG